VIWTTLYQVAVDCVLGAYPFSPVEQPNWSEAEEICSEPDVISVFNQHAIKSLAVEEWKECVIAAQSQIDAGTLQSEKGARALAEIMTRSIKKLKLVAQNNLQLGADPNPDLDSPGKIRHCLLSISSLPSSPSPIKRGG